MNFPSIIPITEGPMGYGISPFGSCEAGYILYRCPGCGRTVKQPMISTYMINTSCTCNLPKCVYVMEMVGSWKHPNWVEFDERTFWEEKGLITDTPYIPYPIKTEEELWLERLEKLENPERNPQSPLPHLLKEKKGNYALNAKVFMQEKCPFWILKIKNFWKEKGKNLLQ